MRSPLLRVAVSVISFAIVSPLAVAQVSTECNRQTPTNCLDGVGAGVTSLDSLRVNLDIDATGADDAESIEGQASLRKLSQIILLCREFYDLVRR